ncbi:hypothetical protein An01g10560 [Aspergillus niger]|uniref:Uncharacterized protein n=2 Tax=Aspergillus niger TaxID=5061 RepID=A2QA85_ASPNC|nr:hypothetical protein An01g10560 [Aspergillus niger]CAK37237.1 hypothetical protein An01g10560 [Aspergillus niger]
MNLKQQLSCSTKSREWLREEARESVFVTSVSCWPRLTLQWHLIKSPFFHAKDTAVSKGCSPTPTDLTFDVLPALDGLRLTVFDPEVVQAEAGTCITECETRLACSAILGVTHAPHAPSTLSVCTTVSLADVLWYRIQQINMCSFVGQPTVTMPRNLSLQPSISRQPIVLLVKHDRQQRTADSSSDATNAMQADTCEPQILLSIGKTRSMGATTPTGRSSGSLTGFSIKNSQVSQACMPVLSASQHSPTNKS